MDIRQLVLVCEKKDEAINNLCNLFDIKVAYHDPGIIFFGLENALLPVGNSFIEVISPVEEGTTAKRSAHIMYKTKGNMSQECQRLDILLLLTLMLCHYCHYPVVICL